jgi:hypothetical protein
MLRHHRRSFGGSQSNLNWFFAADRVKEIASVTREVEEEKIAERQDAPRVVRCGRRHSNIVSRPGRRVRQNLGPSERKLRHLAMAKEIQGPETYGAREKDSGGAERRALHRGNAGRGTCTSIEHATELHAG